jgi:hypothetical protein
VVWVRERRVLLGVLLEVPRVPPKVPRMPPELPRVLLRDRCLRSAAVRLEPLELPQRGLPVEAAHLPRSAAAAARPWPQLHLQNHRRRHRRLHHRRRRPGCRRYLRRLSLSSSAAAAARLRCSAATALLPSSRALRAAAVECHQALRVQLGSPRAAERTATLLW